MSSTGLEPATLCLEGRCSVQLSYEDIISYCTGGNSGVFSNSIISLNPFKLLSIAAIPHIALNISRVGNIYPIRQIVAQTKLINIFLWVFDIFIFSFYKNCFTDFDYQPGLSCNILYLYFYSTTSLISRYFYSDIHGTGRVNSIG